MDVSVDATEVLNGLTTLEGNLNSAGRRALNRAAAILRGTVYQVILEVFEAAVIKAGAGFYPEYAAHLRQGLLSLETDVEVFDPELTVSIGEIEELGDWSDIIEIMHYEAIADDIGSFSISNPPLVDMGADVSQTYGFNQPHGPNSGPDHRAAFWSAMQTGEEFVVQLRGSRQIGVSTEGLLRQTLAARVQAWGNRYPEWLLLDEGLSEGEPTINPTGFVTEIEVRLNAYIDDVFKSVIPEEYDRSTTWDYVVEPIYDERVGTKGGYRDPLTGRFAKRPTK